MGRMMSMILVVIIRTHCIDLACLISLLVWFSVCMSDSKFSWVILCVESVSRCMCMCCICVSPKSSNCWLSRVGQPSCLVDLKGFELLSAQADRPTMLVFLNHPPTSHPTTNNPQPPHKAPQPQPHAHNFLMCKRRKVTTNKLCQENTKLLSCS